MPLDQYGNWVPDGSYAQISQFSLPSTSSGWNPNTGGMNSPVGGATTPFGPGSWDGITAGMPNGGVTPPLSILGKLGGFLGKNGQTIGTLGNLAMNGINAYVGLQQLGMAKDALKFEKKSFKTNLANQVDSYNTQMKDRITGRYYATEEERQAALKEAELPQGMRG